jgi:hypothetical protein
MAREFTDAQILQDKRRIDQGEMFLTKKDQNELARLLSQYQMSLKADIESELVPGTDHPPFGCRSNVARDRTRWKQVDAWIQRLEAGERDRRLHRRRDQRAVSP